jgi:hypothetical protein
VDFPENDITAGQDLIRGLNDLWSRRRGRTDAELDERAGDTLARKLNLQIPTSRPGWALRGELGMMERLGASKTDLHQYAEEQLRQMQPEKRPDPRFRAKPQEIDRAGLVELVDNSQVSRVVRSIVNEDLQVKKPRAKKPLVKKAATRKQQLTSLAQHLPRYVRNG